MFLAYLTVSRLITTVWRELSENSYLREFSAQVSQIVFLSLFDRFTAYYNCMTWNVRKLIFASFPCTSITNRFNCLIDRFTVYYNCMTWSVKNWYLRDFSEQVSQIVFLAYLTVLRFITTVWPEMSENSYLRHFSAQVSQIVFSAY